MGTDEIVKIRIKFKGEENSSVITVTEQQYLNLLEVPVVEQCEIIGGAKRTLSNTEKAKLNERIKIACRNDPSHTQYLLQ